MKRAIDSDIAENIIETGRLSERQIQDIQRLTDVCCKHDRIRLSYPTGLEDETAVISRKEIDVPGDTIDTQDGPGICHWLYYDDNGALLAALALVPYEDSLAECSAFTHPDFRRRGLFSRLLDSALASCEDCDILFTVSGRCPDTDAALRALEAELVSKEYQMELELTEAAFFNAIEAGTALPIKAASACKLRKVVCNSLILESDVSVEGSSSDTVWELICGDMIPGSCRTAMVSGDCACLHHVEIQPRFRRQGLGYELMRQLLPLLYRDGVRRVILQVSGDNPAAIGLYKKTGFRITETLSFYLY